MEAFELFDGFNRLYKWKPALDPQLEIQESHYPAETMDGDLTWYFARGNCMSYPKLFRKTYEDAVVQYFYLPWRRDLRLTVRCGEILVHRKIYDSEILNWIWKNEPAGVNDLASAEEWALRFHGHASSKQNVPNLDSYVKEYIMINCGISH